MTHLPSGLRVSPLVSVVLAAGVIVVLRLPFLHGDLLKSDEALYATMGLAWGHGELPGRDLWDNKPPGMSALYLLAAHLPGGAILASRVLALLCALMTLLGALRLAHLAAPGTPWWPVALAFILITHANGWPPSEWVPLNSEIPAACLVMLGTVCLAEWARRSAGAGRRAAWPMLVTAGVLAGLAVQFRQTAALPVAAVALWLVVVAWRAGGGGGAARAVVPAVAGVALAWVPLLGYYLAQDAWPYVWQAVGGHGLAYSSETIPAETAWRNLREAVGVGLWPALLAAGLVGSLLGLQVVLRQRREGEQERLTMSLLLLAFGLGSLLAVLPGGRFYGHYFIQVAPALSLAAGMGLARLSRPEAAPVIARAVRLLLLLGLIVLVGRVWTGVQAPVDRLVAMNQERYGKAAAAIRARTTPADRVVVWAWAPQVYWYSQRLPACRDVTLNYALGWIGERPQELFPGARAALLSDLARNRPPVILVANDQILPYADSPAWRPAAAPEVWAFMRGHYRLATRLRHWDLYEPRPATSPAVTGAAGAAAPAREPPGREGQ